MLWVARRRGIIQQSLRGRNGENRRGASGHGDQKPYKNTAPFFSGSGVLCKVDSPFSLLCLCMLLLREDSLAITIFWFAGICGQEVLPAVLALAWSVPMVHTVQQIVDEEVHVAVKGNRVKKNKLVFVVRIMGEATMRTHSGDRKSVV